jgi:hypothetical protein
MRRRRTQRRKNDRGPSVGDGMGMKQTDTETEVRCWTNDTIATTASPLVPGH